MKLSSSVIITHFKREANLRKTLCGLASQTIPPDEVIIVEMGERTLGELNYPYTLSIVEMDPDWKFLPLAEARNIGANISSGNQLVFLDVDCIPAPNFCSDMTKASLEKNALVMGTPRYLLTNHASQLAPHYLQSRSKPHPARPVVKGIQKAECYGMFWSLCFSIPRTHFLTISGFSEEFQGYGVEDTDFALKAEQANIPFYISDAKVFHQQHPVYIPPVNHLESIVNNCNRFFQKWHYWAMEDCLAEFSILGYFDWNAHQKNLIEIIKLPDEAQIQQRLVPNAPYR